MSQDRRPLKELEQTTDFVRRHIGPDTDDVADMLATLGMTSLDALIDEVVPPAIFSQPPAAEGRTEAQVLADARTLADRNTPFKSMIGMGYYDCHTPPVILRNVLENPGWYTAYTPYQAEIAQGRLEALLTFQQMVADLTGMEIANASLLDE
ncbi:MAG: glycine dehydrogenase (aminomethyl-transferring), partial [Rhodospirillales bacterium]|nr:glycine dehydrogenase (aminomethyl-transferring) [Rhodospirillales bacterium]